MDLNQVTSDLLRALRGRRSQTAFSRRLGYRGNVCSPWETGRRFPSASAFFSAAERIGIDVAGAVQSFLPDFPPPGDLRKSEGVAALLRTLCGDLPVAGVARLVGVDRTTAGRWLHSATEPRLPEFLAWIDATTHRLLPFIELFVDPLQLPSTRRACEAMRLQLELAYGQPWTQAVLRALELDGYRHLRRHDAAVLARAVGLEEDTVEQCLEQLSRAGQVRCEQGLWVSTDVLTLDTRPSPQKNRALKRHWAAVGLVRLDAAPLVPGPDERSLFSFNLFAVSHADFEQIRQLHIDYYERVRAIVADATLGERVVLLNQQLIDLRRSADSL